VQPETVPNTEERTIATKEDVVSAWGVATIVSAEESDDKDDNHYVNDDDDDKLTMNTSQQSPAAKKQKRFASHLLSQKS
jgi:hypothetical protein